jgi:hypothetical protein
MPRERKAIAWGEEDVENIEGTGFEFGMICGLIRQA